MQSRCHQVCSDLLQVLVQHVLIENKIGIWQDISISHNSENLSRLSWTCILAKAIHDSRINYFFHWTTHFNNLFHHTDDFLWTFWPASFQNSQGVFKFRWPIFYISKTIFNKRNSCIDFPNLAKVWRLRFLITVIDANDRISRVKPVKHRSNLGQPGSSPRKPRQWTLMNSLTKPTHTRGQPLVKDTVKTGLTVDVSECRPELFPRSPKFT
jgi:hypothetical protein